MPGWVTTLITAAVGGGVTAVVLLGTGAVEPGGGELERATAPGRGEPVLPPSATTARAIYERRAPGVVFVRARTVADEPSPFEVLDRAQASVSTGSGFVLDEQGLILTTAHVVSAATEVRVSLADERTVPARPVGADADTDIALLRVDPEGLDLRPLALGDSGSVRVGDPIVAIGNPFGLDRTLTTGIVAALQRRLSAPSGFTIADVIQTDVLLHPGSAGGPLLDAAGRVIGINSEIAATGGGAGIGFAVPIDTAKEIVTQLVESGRVRRAFLGVQGRPVGAGIQVERVEPGSPAERAGLRAGVAAVPGDLPVGGDVLAAIAGERVRSMDDVSRALRRHRPGDPVALDARRGGRALKLRALLGDRPPVVAAE